MFDSGTTVLPHMPQVNVSPVHLQIYMHTFKHNNMYLLMNSDTVFRVVIMFSPARTRTITVGPLPSLQRVKIRILEYSDRTIPVNIIQITSITECNKRGVTQLPCHNTIACLNSCTQSLNIQYYLLRKQSHTYILPYLSKLWILGHTTGRQQVLTKDAVSESSVRVDEFTTKLKLWLQLDTPGTYCIPVVIDIRECREL